MLVGARAHHVEKCVPFDIVNNKVNKTDGLDDIGNPLKVAAS